MWWSWMGQCRTNLEVRPHLERWTIPGTYHRPGLQRHHKTMGHVSTDHPHRVQANKEGESPRVSFESHKRGIGEGHSFEQPIHKTNQQSIAQIGDWQPWQRDLALARGHQGTNGAYKESGWGHHRVPQDHLPPESKCRQHLGWRIPLHHIRLHGANLQWRTTSRRRRRRRSHQHFLRPLRSMGWTIRVDSEVQEDWGSNIGLHLLDIWIALQVRRADIGRRPYLSAANHPVQLLWFCGIVTKVIWNITDFSSPRGVNNLCFQFEVQIRLRRSTALTIWSRMSLKTTHLQTKMKSPSFWTSRVLTSAIPLEFSLGIQSGMKPFHS